MRLRGWIRVGIVLSGLSALLSCREEPIPPPPSPPMAPLRGELSGCAELRAGPACGVPEGGALRVWVEAPASAALAIVIDEGGAAPAADARPVQNGWLVRVTVPQTAHRLEIRAAAGGAASTWSTELVRLPVVPAFAAAGALRAEGRGADALAALDPLLTSADPATRAQATGMHARVLRDLGRVAEAMTGLRTAIELNRAAGRVSAELHDRFALLHTLVYNGRHFGAARALLDGIGALEALDAEGRARAPYYRGVVALEMGDLREASRLFRESAERAARIGLDAHAIDVVQMQATVLTLLRRTGEAQALLDEARAALASSSAACAKAGILGNIGWSLAAADPQPAQLDAAAEVLLQSLAIYEQSCPSPELVVNVLTDLAMTELDRGRPAEAERHLRHAQRVLPGADARLAAAWTEVEGRIALDQGRADAALVHYEKLARLAASGSLPVARFRAALGRAQALEALGRAELAKAAYVEAETVLDDRSLLVPMGEGRSTFLGSFAESSARHVDFLLRRGEPRPAAEVARRSRARFLTALRWVDRVTELPAGQRALWDAALETYKQRRAALDDAAAKDWTLPADELDRVTRARRAEHLQLREALDGALAALGQIDVAPDRTRPLSPPGPDEALLVYHPVRDGWAGFAITTDGTVARRLGPTTPDAQGAALAAALLEPFAAVLGGVMRARVLAYGPLEAVDFHALPWRGGHLIDAVAVAYGIDLPVRAAAAEGAGRAVVVVDPAGDLPFARAEGARVEAALRRGGLSVDVLAGPAATRAAIVPLLEAPGVSSLHYAGHGLARGLDGWESRLPLAGGGWLGVDDILALTRVPDRLVLSACESGASTGPSAGLGIAQAFLLAGASSVIATSRPVDDKTADELMTAFYAAATADAPEALRRAQLAVTHLPQADWPSFRAWTR